VSDLDEFARAYQRVRTRVSDLVSQRDLDALETSAPAAPEWRVRDLLAHLSGVSADITSGNLDGVATDEWTAAQVDARRDWTIDDLISEWAERGAAVDALIPQFPEPIAAQLLVDTATHEQDIRGALEVPGARDADAIALGFPGMATFALGSGLKLETEHGIFVTGDGDGAETSVRAPRFELFRAMTGRRSLEQVRAYDWTGDPRPEALVIGLFTARATPLVE
jgi:uncharacterized protein (TIGR03083 family)